ncbi:putative transcriptional regulator [Legionella gratiana]|uniref:Transcriptional regulator n=1 Tax=Legionella gratiana TaxID=45066 RepID=A0A378J3I7_9GAMM|nr:helix-turn-helix transcriptional regulator [Legionella gratiana]KTD14680.1 putative transcriptional regulator [Legionella gratiana]STX41531.1 putative transcriptional regulator [Legionella gratiana]
MEKTNLAKQFADRLRDAMVAAGYNSQRSTSGVCIHKLSEITGYSLQICRKYLRGKAIPEPIKLVDIAAKLKVSPGWLLFGDPINGPGIVEDKISINKNVLHYIFVKASSLYNSTLSEPEISRFLLELINDVSLINADEDQSKKIIDLALTSVKHFYKP